MIHILINVKNFNHSSLSGEDVCKCSRFIPFFTLFATFCWILLICLFVFESENKLDVVALGTERINNPPPLVA